MISPTTKQMEKPSASLSPAASDSVSAGDSEWRFLGEWFILLGETGVCTRYTGYGSSDDVRIGLDDLSDAWLEMSISSSSLDLYEQQQNPGVDRDAMKKQQLALERDAILLTSLVGKVDYDGWLEMMLEYGEFDLEGPYKIPDASGAIPRVAIQFECDITEQHSLALLDWSSSLGYVFGDLGHSAAFTRDMEKVRELLLKRGISWASIPPTRIKWKIAQRTVAKDVHEAVSRWLMRTVEAIQHTQRLEMRATKDSDDGGCGVLFKIASLEVDLHCAQLYDDVLEALSAILQVGVPIASIHLPVLGSSTPSISRWAPFVRLLTGVDRDAQGRLASAKRIEMPLSYATSFHFSAFCSALSCARGVQVFCMTSMLDAQQFHESDPFGRHEEARRHVWRWLVFAIFSAASTTSVTTLYIGGEKPKSTEIEVIKKMAESATPLELLLQAADPDSQRTVSLVPRVEDSRSVVTIPPMAIFEASDGIRTADCQCRHELIGELLESPLSASGTDERVVFVPGFGLCRGQLSERPEKRMKATPLAASFSSASLKSLVLFSDPRAGMAPDMLLALLEIIGSQLKGLQFCIETNDATLHQVFQLCPNLQSLALKNAKLASMDVFDHAYAHGAKLTSLNLNEIQVPAMALQAFMRKLAVLKPQKGTVAYTLERLSIDFAAASEENNETLKLIELVLQQSSTLTHVDGLYHAPAPVPFGFEDYHAQRIPGLSRQQLNKRMALLGALRAISQRNRALRLDNHLKQHIWEYAVSPRYRRVYWTEW